MFPMTVCERYIGWDKYTRFGAIAHACDGQSLQ
jgi:hypothetical protein